MGGDFHAFSPHQLREAGSFPFHHRFRGFGSDIPGRKAGTAGGEYQGKTQLIGAAEQFCFNSILFIGDNGGVGHMPAVGRKEPAQRRAAGIHTFSPVAFIADSDDCRSQIHTSSSLVKSP